MDPFIPIHIYTGYIGCLLQLLMNEKQIFFWIDKKKKKNEI